MTNMPRHVVAKAAEIPPGSRKLVEIGGRAIVVLNVKGELFALSDKCPHKGGSLSRGKLTGVVTSSEPGSYDYSRPGEILRCPWHGWEFDVRTGRSWCDPKRLRLMNYAVTVEPGAKLVEGPYVAETFPVAVEDDYVVVETK
jgi:nitrite reductase/ring-hydroxylating ferredoxin subunit